MTQFAEVVNVRVSPEEAVAAMATYSGDVNVWVRVFPGVTVGDDVREVSEVTVIVGTVRGDKVVVPLAGAGTLFPAAFTATTATV